MKKNKVLVQNSITYAIVIACWILVQILGATGHMTSLLKGLLVPLCIYVILAVSLNLTVGILGELSLGHAGFMCVGAFTGAFFTKCMENAIPSVGMRFFLALIIGAAVAGVFGIIIGIPVLRLKGDYLAIVTLAFGEIIKNLINVMYVGLDSNGFHFSIKGYHIPWHGRRRRCHHQGRSGYHRYPEGSNLYGRHHPGAHHPVYRIKPDQFPYWTRYHVHP